MRNAGHRDAPRLGARDPPARPHGVRRGRPRRNGRSGRSGARARPGQLLRRQAEERFSVERMVEGYIAAYEKMVAGTLSKGHALRPPPSPWPPRADGGTATERTRPPSCGHSARLESPPLVDAIGSLYDDAIRRVLSGSYRVTSAADGKRLLAAEDTTEAMADHVQRVVMLAVPIVRTLARGARFTRIPWVLVATTAFSIGSTLKAGIREVQTIGSLLTYRIEEATGRPADPDLVQRLALELYLSPRRTPAAHRAPAPAPAAAPAMALQGRLRPRHPPRSREGARRSRAPRSRAVRPAHSLTESGRRAAHAAAPDRTPGARPEEVAAAVVRLLGDEGGVPHGSRLDVAGGRWPAATRRFLARPTRRGQWRRLRTSAKILSAVA